MLSRTGRAYSFSDRPFPIALTAIALFLAADPAVANPRELFAVTGAGSSPSTLYLLDARDGRVIREIGPLGFSHVTDIAFHPVTGVLYGVVSNGDLVTIDPETGAATAVGPHGPHMISDLAFAPSGILYAWTEPSGNLARVNLSTGAATVIGNCEVAARSGLAIDRDGTAFLKQGSSVYTVNRVTGACTHLSELEDELGIEYDNVLAIDDRGTFYTAHRTGSGADIYTLDPVTGVTTRIGSNPLAKLSGLAFQPPPLEPLYAVDGSGGSPTTLYRLDPRDGSVLQTIGPVGFNHVVGLAFHPVTGVLYATANDAAAGLITIDVETGAGTAVGPAFAVNITDISFSPSGGLYGWWANEDLVAIDLTTGGLATVGDCGTATGRTGLAVDAAGQAWLKSVNDLHRVDRVTGACGPAIPLTAGALLDNVLAFNERNTLYTARRTGAAAELYTIDPVTAETLPVGSNGVAALAALAFRPHPLPPLYATDGADTGGGGGPSTLYRLDPRDGSVLETIGPIGFDEVVGLAFHPVTGVLYGTSNGAGQLLRIDPEAGTGTAIGGATGTNLADISFAPSGTLYGWAETTSDLVTIHLASGAATAVGDCGLSTALTGLAIDVTGTARMKSGTALRVVDRVTGACGAALGLTAPGALHDALAYAPGGILYSLERQGGGAAEIFTVDSQTGTVSSIGTNAIATLASLAFKPVRPTSLYGVEGSGGAGFGAGRSPLYLLDPHDASVVANLGPIGFTHVTGIDFHPVTRTLYATANDSGALLSVDPETGAGTVVGAFVGQLPDIDFAPSGILYAWAEFGGGAGDDLARIDVDTGALTTAGDCGINTSASGLAIDEEGTAFMKSGNDLYRVDRATGACTFVTALTVSAHNALAFDDVGLLYTLRRSAGTAELFQVDVATGTSSSIGINDLANLSAIKFRPPPHPVLYATDGAGGNASTLYRLDPRDASVLQTPGPIGFGHVVGLAFQPGTSLLFGTENNGGQLLTINRTTGVGTAVGVHGVQTPDLSFALDGVLYSWSEPAADDLIRIDPVSALATTVGSCGLATGNAGLSIDEFFNAYLSNGLDLVSIDLATGSCAIQTGLTTPLDDGLGFNDQGTLYGIRRNAGLGELYTVDPQTGDVIFVGSNAMSNLAAVGFMPEPSGMLLAGVGALVVLSAWRRRRR